jgi:UDP-glucose 4-epimerase
METKLHTPMTIMDKCIITGGAGFIGSNLAERLLNENIYVTAIDNDSKRKALISEFMKNKMFKFLLKDINNLKVSNINDDVNVVYHLAASADIKKSLDDVKIDLENNVVGTHSILEIMRQKDIEKMIFSSSSAVYGETKVIPTPEDLGDMRPISLYGASKLAAEAFIIAYCSLYGMKAWIFRFANVVGKNEHRGVIFDFVKKLERNPNELEILGDGNQKKSFFDVSDCVSGLVDIPRMDSNRLV